MKAFLYYTLSLLSLFVGYAANAQTIANLNFETWSTRNTIEAPNNWETTDDILHAFIQSQYGISTYINSGTVVKSTTAHSGSYAANLNSRTVTGLTGVVPGIIAVGTNLGPYLLAGTPYTSRPTQLQFYYQFTGAASDSAAAEVLLTTTVNGKPQLLGSAEAYLQPTTTGSYILVALPIAYSSSVTPDSVRILFSSGSASKLTAGSTLLVDDVTLTGVALAVRADASIQDLLTVAPNPSPGGRFVISSPDKPELAASPLQVLDALGRTVAQQPAQAVPSGPRELDLGTLGAGIYLLRLDSRQGAIVRQLTVK